MRKEKLVRIDAPGRDSGKVFRIKEAPAVLAESWLNRGLLAAGNAGFLNAANLVASAQAGDWISTAAAVIAGMQWQEAQQLLAEMFSTCVQMVPDPTKDFTRPLVENGSDGDDIEEVATRLRLRSEVIEIHTGFSIAAALSTSRSSQTTAAGSDGPTTQTSPAPSAGLSKAA